MQFVFHLRVGPRVPRSRRGGTQGPVALRLGTVLACAALTLQPGHGAAQRVSDVTNATVREAVTAYNAGELGRAMELLLSVPTSLAAVDGSVRALYMGLIYVAQSDPVQARESFMLAVRLDPGARLDPALHAPSRIMAFEAARDAVVEQWRAAAVDAAARGDREAELRLLQTVLVALPGDEAAQSRIDQIEEEMRLEEAAREAARAAADSLAQLAAGQGDTAAAPNGTARRLRSYNSGQALAMGLVVPGLGQVYSGRHVLGLLSLAAAGGAVAAGVLTEHVKIDCRIQPVNGTCPAPDILGQRTERPYLTAGLAGAAAVTLAGALDAFFAARRANSAVAEARRSRSGGAVVAIAPSVRVGFRTVQVEWARIRF
jgi:hypothetical protein